MLNATKHMLAQALAWKTYKQTVQHGEEQCLIDEVQCSPICPLVQGTTMEDQLDKLIPPKPLYNANPSTARILDRLPENHFPTFPV